MNFFGHSGSAPAPFDGLNGPRLAGPDGSHPLHDVRPEDLLRAATDGLRGDAAVERPVGVV